MQQLLVRMFGNLYVYQALTQIQPFVFLIWLKCKYISGMGIRSHGGGCATLLAVGRGQRTGRHLGGGAAWWTLPPRILPCWPVVCLTSPFGVGGAWEKKEDSASDQHLIGLNLGPFFCFVTSFFTLINQEAVIASPLLMHSLCYFLRLTFSSLFILLVNFYSSLNLILVLIFHVYNTTTSPVFPFNTHQSHPGRWFGGSEASGWMTRCAVP